VSETPESRSLTAGDLMDHLLLSALWGASFLFMRVAVPEFGPFALMGVRCMIGAVGLLVLLWWVGDLGKLGERRGVGMTIGVLNSAIPFVLLAYAALVIGSGLLSIINAMAPFWGAVIGWLWLRLPLTRWQLLGLLLGFIGVALLVISAGRLDVESSTGIAAVVAGVLATVFYGFSANFAKQYLQNTNPLVNATNSQLGASVVLLVPTVIFWPATAVSGLAWGSVIALGVFCTALAYVLFFRLIEKIGASRAITVVFVVPLFAVAFGAIFLNESIGIPMVLSGCVIVLGSALALKLLPRRLG